MESQKPIISIFLTVGVLSRFLAKFETEFFEHGFLNTEKAINKVLKKRVQNYFILLSYFLGLKSANGKSRKQNQYHSFNYMIKLQKKLS